EFEGATDALRELLNWRFSFLLLRRALPKQNFGVSLFDASWQEIGDRKTKGLGQQTKFSQRGFYATYDLGDPFRGDPGLLAYLSDRELTLPDPLCEIDH